MNIRQLSEADQQRLIRDVVAAVGLPPSTSFLLFHWPDNEVCVLQFDPIMTRQGVANYLVTLAELVVTRRVPALETLVRPRSFWARLWACLWHQTEKSK